jgi:hypothetical protein
LIVVPTTRGSAWLAVALTAVGVTLGALVVAGVGAPAAGAATPRADGARYERDLLGHSVAGRPIYAYRLGSPYSTTKAVVLGNIHGDEPAGITVANTIIHGKGVHDIDLWVIPTINPDGTAAHRHGNAHGVDLNRNFPYRWTHTAPGYQYSGPSALSEPESRIMLNFLNRIKPRYFVSMHQPLNGVDTTDGGARAPAFRLRLATNLGLHQKAFTCGGVCLGTMTGWFTHYQHGAGITVEFPGAVANSYLTGRAAPGIVKAMGARYDTVADHNPIGHVDSLRSKGLAVQVNGWTLDPDIRSKPITVQVTEGTGVKWQHSTSVPRSDVNRLFHATGNHGFQAQFPAGRGRHGYCVHFINYGAGTGSPAVCRIITVTG